VNFAAIDRANVCAALRDAIQSIGQTLQRVGNLRTHC